MGQNDGMKGSSEEPAIQFHDACNARGRDRSAARALRTGRFRDEVSERVEMVEGDLQRVERVRAVHQLELTTLSGGRDEGDE